MTAPRIRVAVYIVRHPRTSPELLVFDHVGMPEAGTQIPAGGVEPGETLAEAALREIAEESGLTNVSLVREIGVEEKNHPITGAPRRTTFFIAELVGDCPDAWEHKVCAVGEDDGLVLSFRFVPLPLSYRLADLQDDLLAAVYERWRSTPAMAYP